MVRVKRLIAILSAAVILACLSSCSGLSDANDTNGSNQHNVAAEDDKYPSPEESKWEESTNVTGARFDLTLREYTDEFNDMYNSLGGGSEELDFNNWKLQKSGQYDENGVEYDYYYYADDKAVLTATVETVSGKLMNLGCGTTLSVFVDGSDARYQGIILNMTGIMACVAGGYAVDHVRFFSNMYVDTISNSNSSFWYNNCIYLLNIEEGETDDTSTMLFRVVAAKESIEEDWNLIDYKTFLQNSTQSSAPGGQTATIATGIQGAEPDK